MPNDYVSAFNRLVKQEQRFKKDPVLKKDYFEFMGKLFKDGHTMELDKDDINGKGGCT